MEKEKCWKQKSLVQREEVVPIQEKKLIAELETADELINDATSKLHEALSSNSFNKQGAQVAYMMMDTGKTKKGSSQKDIGRNKRKAKGTGNENPQIT